MELSQERGQDVKDLGKDMKAAFGPSWKEALCEKQLLEGKVDPGCPALLIISTSALRSIELLRCDCFLFVIISPSYDTFSLSLFYCYITEELVNAFAPIGAFGP